MLVAGVQWGGEGKAPPYTPVAVPLSHQKTSDFKSSVGRCGPASEAEAWAFLVLTLMVGVRHLILNETY